MYQQIVFFCFKINIEVAWNKTKLKNQTKVCYFYVTYIFLMAFKPVTKSVGFAQNVLFAFTD